MGAAASISIFKQKAPTGKVTEKMNSIQDDARSFRSKSAAIKMLIRTEDSRQAFRSYILKTLTKGEVEYLDYFLAVEAIKKGGHDKQTMHKQFRAIIKQYELKSHDTNHPVVTSIYATTHSWQGIDTLNEAELLKLMNRSQEDILSILTPNFEKFIESKVYQEYTKGQNAREKRRASGSHPVDLLPVVPFSPRDRPGQGPPIFTPSKNPSQGKLDSVPGSGRGSGLTSNSNMLSKESSNVVDSKIRNEIGKEVVKDVVKEVEKDSGKDVVKDVVKEVVKENKKIESTSDTTVSGGNDMGSGDGTNIVSTDTESRIISLLTNDNLVVAEESHISVHS